MRRLNNGLLARILTGMTGWVSLVPAQKPPRRSPYAGQPNLRYCKGTQ